MFTIGLRIIFITAVVVFILAPRVVSSPQRFGEPQQVLQYAQKSYNRSLTFEDINTPAAINNITVYNNILFQSFHLLNTTTAASTGAISPKDINCALSSPNALTGNRHSNPQIWPRFTLTTDAAAAAGIAPLFNLHGVALKAMNDTKPWTGVMIQAYGIINGEIRTHYEVGIWYPRGGSWPNIHGRPFSKTWPGWGRGVNMVEVWSEERGGADWDFCIDNLDVEFWEADDESVTKVLDREPGNGLLWEMHQEVML